LSGQDTTNANKKRTIIVQAHYYSGWLEMPS